MKSTGEPFESPAGDGRPYTVEDKVALKVIRRAARTVVGLDLSVKMERDLEKVIEDGRRASERGYFTPDEDERVLGEFGRYLRTRNVLYGTIVEMQRIIHRSGHPDKIRIGAYAVGLAAACILFRAGQFLIGYKSMKVVSRKLDQGEPRHGIPRKQFTKIYFALTKTYNIYRFHKAVRFVREHWSEVEALGASDPELEPVVDLLRRENPEAAFQTKRLYALNRLGYFRYSLARRRNSTFQVLLFKLFEMVGRTVSSMRVPFRRKGVTAEIRERALEILRPGDVIATRDNGAMLNYFLPGYWPHVALYIGLAEERRGLGVEMSQDRWERSSGAVRVLEARKDGVLFRPLRETLAVDSFVIIRPDLNREELAQGLTRAMTHEGKQFNHEFDFTKGDRLACTELVYRSFHAMGPIEFELVRRLNRIALTTEDLLDYAVKGRGFSVVALFGAKGSPLLLGEEAREALAQTYESPPGARAEKVDAAPPESAPEEAPENPLRERSSALS